MNISFALTTDQVRRRLKNETRRLAWEHLQPGKVLHGMVKCQGLKKGEHPEFITAIRVVHVRSERLNEITPDAVAREGFPHMSPAKFVAMFCKHNGCEPSRKITVISFDYPWKASVQPTGVAWNHQEIDIWWSTSKEMLTLDIESRGGKALWIHPHLMSF